MTPRKSTSSKVICQKQVKTVLLLAAVLLTGCTDRNIEDLRQFVAATKAASPGRKPGPLPEIEPYRPITYTAQGLKDPFAPSAFVKRPEEPYVLQPKIKNGIHPDPDRPREELEKYALGSLKMVGTFTNAQQIEQWALIKAPDGIIHRVQTGNYLGADHGKILNITEQRIDLQEIIPDDDRGWKKRDAFLSLAE